MPEARQWVGDQLQLTEVWQSGQLAPIRLFPVDVDEDLLQVGAFLPESTDEPTDIAGTGDVEGVAGVVDLAEHLTHGTTSHGKAEYRPVFRTAFLRVELGYIGVDNGAAGAGSSFYNRSWMVS